MYIDFEGDTEVHKSLGSKYKSQVEINIVERICNSLLIFSFKETVTLKTLQVMLFPFYG